MSDIVDRFIRYIKVDTQSNPDSTTFPSTSKQFNLAKILFDELRSLGLKDLSLDDNGYVMASLPSNSTRNVPSIGWIAHMDTSPDMSGEGVNPKFIQKYDGGDIVLNAEKKIVLSPSDFPEMRNYIGQTLITTDGTTLLGADDKAGVAAIMAVVQHLIHHPEIEHGPLKICFTPDEEVGQGAERFDVKKFGADFAYTIDGGEVGELEYENFNAAGAKILIKGRGVHPGTAKNKMINAINIAMDIAGALPAQMKPEFTEKNEGFFHLMRFDGTIEEASLQYIIREHDKDKFEWQKGLIQRIVQNANYKYGPGTANLELKDQYYNMKEKILPVMHIVETAREAIEAVGLTPKIIPVRGGTDGARLSYMGLPCPNIFTGGHNAHGRFEYLPLESLEKAEEVILKIIDLYTDRSEKG